ncbi:MAG: ABC transporter ATP-binding protein [Bacteroidales bacterium]
MVTANNIHKSFGNLQVLKGISLEIRKGEIVSIAGASGAGKSTLLHIIGSLDKPDTGRIIINNTLISGMNEKKRSDFRNRHIGFVFQFHHLLPEFNALENISIPAYIAGSSRKEAETRARQLLDFLNLTDRWDHKPSEMSGGEQQRVAIARALINNPSVVLADEPSGNLDSNASVALHELFIRLRDTFEQTFIVVTHNKELASLADRRLLIHDGLISARA